MLQQRPPSIWKARGEALRAVLVPFHGFGIPAIAVRMPYGVRVIAANENLERKN